MALDEEQLGTEAPTPRRREEARKQGQVPHSADLAAGVGLVGGVLLLSILGESIARQLAEALRTGLAVDRVTDWGPTETILSARWFCAHLATIAVVPVAVIMVLGLLVGTAQAGIHVNFDALSPKWEKLSPARGWSRIASLDSLARGVLTLLKATAVLLVGFWIARGGVSGYKSSGRGSLMDAATLGWNSGERIALAISAGVLIVGVADYAFQWFRNEQRLMMTREQIKQEQKDENGDPQLKARIRKMQRDAAHSRMLKDVPRATVVLTNPTHLAVALHYDRGTMAAPRIVAKGAGVMAKRIIAIARENGVPVLERKPIARALYRAAQIGHEIPIELYHAVAEILAAIYRLKRPAA